ncbi:penicillin-binding protein 1A [Silvimonas iriomotensis]|uniref:peptidoglycan glycosyltransferase n=1 Tax=Silvimonas iriomotensis TaxID=449662 RepID=A0ABQ2PE28_9NEIS|nr:PBP1A family penicillin-binding protein [Silvimonas iriomotensis]GGP23415.1 penicillin-binding protein 1A [Silvimonas iriomotensis]
MNASNSSRPGRPWLRIFALVAGLLLGLTVALGCAAGWWLWQVWQGLPSIKELAVYQPAQPLRIYADDGKTLLAEYGEERRDVLPLSAIPKRMQLALLAIEDARYYEHGAVDFGGMARAALANITTGRHGQGASTISMQVARNFYLTREKTFTRKITEMLLAFKLEQEYGKDRLLELYMNQVYLGERAYGFAAAANIYFGKPVSEITLAQAAMLAGLPKAPSANNPVNNPERARQRQQYILKRMLELGYISDAEYQAALAEPLQLAPDHTAIREAAWPVEAVRQWAVARYGEQAYALGLDITTTINLPAQKHADAVVRAHLLNLQAASGFRGAVKTVALSHDGPDAKTIRSLLAATPDSADDVLAVLITGRQGDVFNAVQRDGTPLELVSDKSAAAGKLGRGAIVYARDMGKARWQLISLPQMEASLVSLDSQTGDIEALVGGFDFDRNKYDRALQAYRQPGSAFKPFIYGAAIEKGFFPGTLVDDTQRQLGRTETGAQPWRPKNYGDNYEGFITVRRGLARSKNLVAVGLMQAAGAPYAQQYAMQFGFNAARNPPSLPLALGSGSVTATQMAAGYAVFANGGTLYSPRLIKSVRDRKGKVLIAEPARPKGRRVVSERNAWMVDSLLRSVVHEGTGRGAMVLGRDDLAGKTGTSNDARDAWFAGYGGDLVTVVWMGYDQPRSLGRRTGGTLSLPVWVDYMKTALADRPQRERPVPDGVAQTMQDYVYTEYTQGACVDDAHGFIRSAVKCARVVVTDTSSAAAQEGHEQSERDAIIQMFSNDD